MNLRNVKQVHASTRRNRLAQVLVTAAVVVLAHLAYGVDAAGGRTTLEEAHSGWNTTNVSGKTYEYDPENRLIGVNGGQVQIAYDGDGHRVSKTVATPGGGSRTTYYLVDDLNPTGHAQVLEEWEASGTEPPRLVRNYAHGLDLISVRDSSDGQGEPTTHYYGHDGHGSVRFLTGEAGSAVSDTYTYDAYGVLLAQTPADANTRTSNNYLYAGEEWDHDLGLYYNRARYMDPNLGRFWTMDTFEGHQSDLLSLHKYLYAHADPVNGTDPSGHEYTLTGQLDVTGTQGIIARQILPALGRVKPFARGAVSRSMVSAARLRQLDPGQYLIDRAFGMAVSVLTLEAGIGVGLALDEGEETKGKVLYRGMKGDTMPELGESSTKLGIRDDDIPLTRNGQVLPVHQGLSVTPENPSFLPPFILDELRKGKAKVWGIYEGLLDSRLTYRPDVAKPDSHGFIAPASAMPVVEYKRLIRETQRQWAPLTP